MLRQFFKYSWRPSTRKCYITHINRWAVWAIENGVMVLDSLLAAVSKYLRIYFDKGVGYGAINVAKCALSLILPHSQGAMIGEHFLIKCLKKKCHEQRPPQPRYNSFWNVQVVLDWILSLSHNSELTLKLLSFK